VLKDFWVNFILQTPTGGGPKNNMSNIESQFIESAKRLIDVYQRKVKRLQSLVTEWETEAEQRELSMPDLIEEVKKKINRPPPDVAVNGHANGQLDNVKPETASQWIRFAIQQNPENVTVPNVLRIIAVAAPSVKISSARVSTGFYDLVKVGELEVMEKYPGKPSLHRATSKFQPWIRFKRVDKERLAF
jgi:hypothetical protein